MNYIKQNHLTLAIIAILVIGWLYAGMGSSVLGASEVTTITNPWTFQENVTLSTANLTSTGGSTALATTTVEHLNFGGRLYATSTTDTTATLLAADLTDTSRIEFTPNVVSITLTLPATSTLSAVIPNSGDTMVVTLENATTTAGTDGAVTLAAGTGMNFKNSSTTLVFRAGNATPLIFQRESDTDISVFLDPR